MASVTLWQVWKIRNEVIFQGGKFNRETVVLLIKRESFRILVNHNLVSKTELNLWFIDPSTAVGRFAESKKYLFFSNLFREFDKVAFSDGSWNVSDGKGGMGGIIFSNHFIINYAYSGPLVASNALMGEIEACKFICNKIGQALHNEKCVVCVDSKNVSEMFDNAKAGI